MRALPVLLAIATLLSPACTEQRRQPRSGVARDSLPPLDTIPPIGARVRVVVPQLGAGWRVGMFNRTRQEPPCYLVLLPDTSPIHRVAVTIAIRAATHLQINRLRAGDISEPGPSASRFDKETWRDVRLEPVQATGHNCSDSVRPG